MCGNIINDHLWLNLFKSKNIYNNSSLMIILWIAKRKFLPHKLLNNHYKKKKSMKYNTTYQIIETKFCQEIIWISHQII